VLFIWFLNKGEMRVNGRVAVIGKEKNASRIIVKKR
jgi:hypothetical protein